MKGGFRPKQCWIWSDGCNFQIKNKIPLCFMSCYPHLIGGCICTWSLFGSRHGKGPRDGVGAILKRFI
jgi:hypothetical protein